MPDKSKQNNIGVSAIARAKKKNMLKKQRLAIILVAAAILLLIVALLFVNYIVEIYVFEDVDGTKYDIKKENGSYALYHKSGEKCDTTEFSGKTYFQTKLGTMVSVDPTTGEATIFAIVDTDGTEVQDFGEYVLMFKQLTYDAKSTTDQSKVIKSIEVHNRDLESGEDRTFTFMRDEKGNFVIKGSEATPYSAESFAQLAVACGYTLSTRRLQNPVRLPGGEIDYAEYGLAPETRVRVTTDEDGNEIEEEYEYTPAWYIITTMTGESHKVIVGDMTVTETGYYAKYEGRDTIYVIGSNGISNLLGRIEEFVVPTIVYPMQLTNYFNVSDFRIYDNIDYNAIYSELAKKFGEDDIGSEEFLTEYQKLFDIYSHKVCDFYYSDLSERTGGMYAYIPYISKLDYAAGYYLDSNNVDLMLSGFYQTNFGEVIKLSPSDEELALYGLENSPYVVGFLFRTKDDKGQTVYVENFVEISEKNDQTGMFYAYSRTYDMIVTVHESSFGFLEWDDTYWYDDSYVQLSISNIESIKIESPGFSTNFVIEDSASKYLEYIARSGSRITVGETEYKIVRDAETGKYILSMGGNKVDPLYVGDYLTTPTTYSVGTPEGDGYLFYESSKVDINGDGTDDGYIHYYYNITKDSVGDYGLGAYVLYTDMNGNQLSDTKYVAGDIAYQTDYFIIQNGYLYYAGEYSAIGPYLKKTYADLNRGKFGVGCVFVSASGSYVLIDSETGEWYYVSDVTSGLYLADDYYSRLAERAVEIPTKYNANGTVKRFGEIYYPMTDKKVQYNEDKDTIEAYDAVNKVWNKITYSECTIGVWSQCEYYVIEGGKLIVVDTNTGDWGEVRVLSNPIYVAAIMSDGKLLDYTISKEGYSASSKIATAMQNFQELYKYLLTASFEGMADLSESEKAALRELDDFTTGGENGECVLKITLNATDYKGNTRDVVYRFYRYSERRAYITIELLDENGSSSEKAYGNFCVLYSFVQKLIADAQRVINADPVYSDNKY